jgi:hypothetical protein
MEDGGTAALRNGSQCELPRNPISRSSATENPAPPGALCALLSLSCSRLGLSVVYRSYTLEGNQVQPLRGHGVVCGLL